MTRFIDTLTSEQRKQFPMATGLLDYAPDALAAVSHVSWLGNQKHNPGQPLHHARGKSMDHADCVVRHMSTRHEVDPGYADTLIAAVFHEAEAAWRVLMDLQQRMEEIYGLTMAPAARPAVPVTAIAPWPEEPPPPPRRVDEACPATVTEFCGDAAHCDCRAAAEARAEAAADVAHQAETFHAIPEGRASVVTDMCEFYDPATDRRCDLRAGHIGPHRNTDEVIY